MRRRIDMTEVEAATKIRAKYLRALENEEWDLLPGPTFVKTFLRTYAEYLELDPRLLVEEYRQRFERPSTQDLTPFRPGHGRRGRQRQRQRRPIGPFVVIGLGILIVLGALYVLGASGAIAAERGAEHGAPTPTATPTADARQEPDGAKKKKKAAPHARVAEAHRHRPRLRVPGRRDRQGRRQRRLPREGRRAPRRSARALPRQLRQQLGAHELRRQALLRRPTSASRSATSCGRARSPSA